MDGRRGGLGDDVGFRAGGRRSCQQCFLLLQTTPIKTGRENRLLRRALVVRMNPRFVRKIRALTEARGKVCKLRLAPNRSTKRTSVLAEPGCAARTRSLPCSLPICRSFSLPPCFPLCVSPSLGASRAPSLARHVRRGIDGSSTSCLIYQSHPRRGKGRSRCRCDGRGPCHGSDGVPLTT